MYLTINKTFLMGYYSVDPFVKFSEFISLRFWLANFTKMRTDWVHAFRAEELASTIIRPGPSQDWTKCLWPPRCVTVAEIDVLGHPLSPRYMIVQPNFIQIHNRTTLFFTNLLDGPKVYRILSMSFLSPM